MRTIVYAGVLLSVTLLHIQLKFTECSSLPRQCAMKFCEEGTICVVSRRGIASCDPISSKPGVCPTQLTNPNCLSLRGAPECLLDVDCPGTTKCCRACCQEATTQSQLDRARFSTDLKPGICPDQLAFVDVFWWTDLFCRDTGFVNDCQKDTECPGPDKCCPALCGNECARIRFDAPRPEDNGTPPISGGTTDSTTSSQTTTESIVESATKRIAVSTTKSTTQPTAVSTAESTTSSSDATTVSIDTDPTKLTTESLPKSSAESTTDSATRSTTESTAESTTIMNTKSTTENETLTQIVVSNLTVYNSNSSSANLNETSSKLGDNVNKLKSGLLEGDVTEPEFEHGASNVVEKAVGLVAQNISAHDVNRNDSATNISDKQKKTTLASTTQRSVANKLTTVTTTVEPTTTTTTPARQTEALANGRDNKKSEVSRGGLHVYIKTEG